MTDTAFDHTQPWTESEYFALGETASRVELIDGCLLISPKSGVPHQGIILRLLRALSDRAQAAGLHAFPTINLRLGPDRVANPDLVIDDGDWGASFTWASEAVLVGEVVSESSTLVDRVLRRQLYADAGIAWYLLAEPSLPDYGTVTLRLFRLAGDHYVKHAVAQHGETLKSDDPFPFEISTEDLIGA